MAKNAESIIQGLNIIPTDNTTISDELSPMSDDIEAQLALWTNLQFPSPNTLPSSSSSVHHPDADQMIEEDERIFSPERDNASRSRHKAVDDFPSGHFFGNVGASMAHHHYHSHPGSHAAAHERAKFQQFQQQLLRNNNNKNNNNKGHDNNATAAAANGNGNGSAAGGDHQINELFSFFPDGDMNINPVDPFLNPSDVAAGVGGGGGGYLPPLTIRHPIHGRPQHPTFPVHNSNMPQLQMHHQQQQQQQQQMQTIDPSTTTLGHHHHVSLPHALPSPTAPSMKRQQKKGSVSSSSSRNGIIPVDHDYTTAPNSAIGGDDDMDHEYRLHNPDHDDSNGNGNGMDGLDDLNNPPPPPQLDASGNPIPYSPAEDKRRRNTLASARFRQKKKEREAAMERKARELDERVSGLERECESLRKENRMLRGLLVDGVPAAVTSITSSSLISSSSNSSNSNGSSNANSASTSSNSAEELSDGKRNFIGSRESVVLLEEFVKLLKANSSMLNNGGGNEGQGHGHGHAAPTPSNGRTGTTTTAGKRKRGGGN